MATERTIQCSRHNDFMFYHTEGGINPGITMDQGIDPGNDFYLTGVYLHLSVVHASVEDFVCTLSSVLGSAYNVTLFSNAMNGVKDYTWEPSNPMLFLSGDVLWFSMVMSASNYYGLKVTGWNITG